MNNTLSFKLIQANLAWENADANLSHLNEMIDAGEHADVVVLPEMFATGFSMNPGNLADESFAKAYAWMKKKAAESSIVICGSLMCKENGNYYNRFVWMPPDGNALFYDKKHLFSLTHEDEFFKPGTQKLIINYKGFNIRPMICYDLRFPAWNRNKLNDDKAEYDILLYVANWPERRIEHWKSLLKARAIENSAFVVAVNRVGADGNGFVYTGMSAAINYKGDAVFLNENLEQAEVFTVESASLEEYRKAFPVLRDADDFELKG